MKINYLQIEDWCILKDFEIHFDKKISVLIGENGSGKSSVLEAIALIFGHLYKYFVENKINDDFIEGYSIDYNITVNGVEHNIVINSISYQPQNEDDGVFKHLLLIDDEEYTRKDADKKFKDLGGFKAFLPNSIVLYYAGLSTHISDLCRHFDEKYRMQLTKGGNNYSLDNLPKERPFFFCDLKHLSNILLCLMISDKAGLDEIPNKLNIDPLSVYILIELKEPSWKKSGIENFWGASDGAIKDFLSELNKYAYKTDFNADKKKIVFHYVGILNLKDMLSNLNVENKEILLFRMLDIILFNDLLFNISLKWKNSEGNVIEIDRLSEGEKQLILTSGLASLWSVENSLLLLDEPDTFLHPKWQVDFIPRLTEIITDNQAIVTTHSPLLISSMKEGDVISMKKGKASYFTLPTYGKDSNTILLQAMDSLTRVKEIDDKFIILENLISENKLEEAKSFLDDLKDLLNDDSNPNLIRFSSIIKRKLITGK